MSLVNILPSQGRCIHCFVGLEEEKQLVCETCYHHPAPYKRVACAVEYASPAGTLVRELKYKGRVDFAKTLASFMVIQIGKLEWPLPDLIVPAPQTFIRRFERGYNQSALIAKHMGQMLNIETKEILKRKIGGFSQNKLSKAQREELSEDLFSYKETEEISGKTILLIDDVLTTSSTLRCSAKALKEGFPKAIYALCFCIAEK